MSDPSGNYGGWKATCIGNNSQAAMSMLKQEYKDDDEMNLNNALKLAVKVLSKTLDTTKLTSERVEMATLSRQDGKTVITILSNAAVSKLCTEYEEEKARLEAEKKEKEKTPRKK